MTDFTHREAEKPVVDRNQPPFTKRRVGNLSVWSKELEIAHGFAQREGLTFELRDVPYQVARLIGPGVRIIVYPHKTTSTGNVSLRVRDENSANPDLADEVMAKMDALVPGYNTFSRHLSMAAWERTKARRAKALGQQAAVSPDTQVGTETKSECTK